MRKGSGGGPLGPAEGSQIPLRRLDFLIGMQNTADFDLKLEYRDGATPPSRLYRDADPGNCIHRGCHVLPASYPACNFRNVARKGNHGRQRCSRSERLPDGKSLGYTRGFVLLRDK